MDSAYRLSENVPWSGFRARREKPSPASNAASIAPSALTNSLSASSNVSNWPPRRRAPPKPVPTSAPAPHLVLVGRLRRELGSFRKNRLLPGRPLFDPLSAAGTSAFLRAALLNEADPVSGGTS